MNRYLVVLISSVLFCMCFGAQASLNRALAFKDKAVQTEDVEQAKKYLGQAESLLADIITQDPENAQALQALGIVKYRQQEFPQAKTYFENAIKYAASDSLREDTLYNLGRVQAELKEYESGIDSFQKVLELNKENEKARHNLEILKKLLEQQKQQEEEQKKEDDQQKQEQQDQKEEDEKQQQDQQQEKQKEQDQQKQKQDQQQQGDQQDLGGSGDMEGQEGEDQNGGQGDQQDEVKKDKQEKQEQQGDEREEQELESKEREEQRERDKQSGKQEDEAHTQEPQQGKDDDKRGGEQKQQQAEGSAQDKAEDRKDQREQEAEDQKTGQQEEERKKEEHEAPSQEETELEVDDSIIEDEIQNGGYSLEEDDRFSEREKMILRLLEETEEGGKRKMIQHKLKQMPKDDEGKNW